MASQKVWQYLQKILAEKQVAHLTLIDPDPLKQSSQEAAKIAKLAMEAGSDAIMVGGSTAQGILDTTILAIKKQIKKPIILFPGNVNGISPHADAIFFMSLFNSSNPYFIVGAQSFSAFSTKMFKLEPIGMAYIIIEPGGTAGYIGQSRPVPRDKPLITVSYALAAQYFGFKLIYLEAGSGANNSVPLEMISTVKKYVDIPVIVGGGIRTKKQAANIIKAGADMIVQGTFVEETLLKEGPEKLKETINELKKVPKTREK